MNNLKLSGEEFIMVLDSDNRPISPLSDGFSDDESLSQSGENHEAAIAPDNTDCALPNTSPSSVISEKSVSNKGNAKI